jgi:hypothetical protein
MAGLKSNQNVITAAIARCEFWKEAYRAGDT